MAFTPSVIPYPLRLDGLEVKLAKVCVCPLSENVEPFVKVIFVPLFDTLVTALPEPVVSMLVALPPSKLEIRESRALMEYAEAISERFSVVSLIASE